MRPSVAPAPTCPRCGSHEMSRLMSRFATVKSEDARLESLADSASFGDVDENDPGSVARFMKKMGKEFGDEMGDDFEAAVDEAMSESADGTGDGVGESSEASSGSADDL